MDRFFPCAMIRLFCLSSLLLATQFVTAQLVISEIAPNAEIEGLEQYAAGEWFEICNVGSVPMDISGYTIGHYEDASFGQSDFYLGQENDNCDCGGSYGVIQLVGNNQSGDVVLPQGQCLVIVGQSVDCEGAYYCLNARDLMLNGASGIVAQYNSSRSDYPGSGNGTGKGALEGHFWRQKNYECNAYYIWNANDVIIDAVNFNCLPQTGPDSDANNLSGGFHYPDGNGGYYSYPPAFPTPPAQGPFPVGIEITSSDYTWVGESIEEGYTYQRCSNDPSFVFPPMRYTEANNQPDTNYYTPTCGQLNDECCTNCDNNEFFQGIQLPNCTNGSSVGLIIEENENVAVAEIMSSVAPSCNNNESRLRSNYDENEISFCTNISTPANLERPFVGFVNSLDEVFADPDCSVFIGATIFSTDDCSSPPISGSLSSKGRAIFGLETETDYTLCFNYDISNCQFKNRIYWDNPCFSPFYCELDVQCPLVERDTFNCLSELPSPVTDTTSFRTELGGLVLSSCDDVSITSVDSVGIPFGIKHERIVYRTYSLTDGLDTIDCTIRYYIINRIPPTLLLNTDTVYLEANGQLDLSPEDFIARAYDTCSDTIEFAIIDPTSVDGNNLGNFLIEVAVIDSANNQTTDTITIVVADDTPPTVICPPDTIIHVLPCACEATYLFTEPVTTDELGGVVTIVRLDTTGLENGDPFPAGTTTIVYSATDESGNETICSYDVTVNSGDPGPIFLKAQLNFSLSEICDGYPTAAMLVEGMLPCGEDSYDVSVFDPNGNIIPEDELRNYRNIILEVEVSYACFNNSNTTDILVEDKFAPIISCSHDTISCEAFFTFEDPIPMDNCDDDVTIVLLNETLENVSCTDPNLTRIIRRTYTAVDDDGRMSDTCFQILSIAKFDLSTVEFLGTDTTIYCADVDQFDENGQISPAIAGYPVAGDVSLWPDQNSICGVSSSYEDVLIPGTSCGYSIARQWTVMYWDCFSDGMVQFFQTINVTDNVGPAFSCPDTLRISTDNTSCTAFLQIDLPLAQDACNNGVRFDIDYPQSFVSGASNMEQTLEIGIHIIEINAVDECENISSCPFVVEVVDETSPIPIINGSQIVNLSESSAIITAEQLDLASYDNCGIESLLIARMDSECNPNDTNFSAQVELCCNDVGNEVMILFMVTDESGNTSMAMTSVTVTDATAPLLVEGLPDITISCDFPYISGETALFGGVSMNANGRDTIIIDADSVLFSGPAIDALVDENCGMTITDEIISEDILFSCGTGSLSREITVTDNAGNAVSFVQNITFTNFFPLVNSDIDWPEDYTVLDACDILGLDPNNLPTDHAEPIANTDVCDNIAISQIDDIDYGPFAGDTIFVINRQWSVADWCQNINNQFVTFDSTQLIIGLDLVEPGIIGGCDEINECNISPNCEDLDISIAINAMDNCTTSENLEYHYEVDFNQNGNIDVTGATNSTTIAFPIGEHTIQWTVTDAQGNSDICMQLVTIDNCNLPSPVCIQDLEFYVEPVDTDGDSVFDDEQVTITVDQVDGGSSIACGAPFLLSFSEDTNSTDTTFSCDNIGLQTLRLYVTDENNGNQDFCEFMVEIVDTNDVEICLLNTLNVVVSGQITNEDAVLADDVKVTLEGSSYVTETSDGYYSFDPMESGGSYSLIPELETYALDGITTYDIILIQKHILGIDALDTPYKLLAADANGSGHISGGDIIALRRLILGADTELANQDEWQFVWKDQEFLDIHSPWLDAKSSYAINSLNENMDIDFIAMKTGDVNHSATMFSSKEAETRGYSNMQYEIIDNDDELIIPVYIDDLEELDGFQFSFRYDYKSYNFSSFMAGKLDLTAANYSDKDQDLGVIDVSWNRSYFQEELNSSEIAFYIILEKYDLSTLSPIDLKVFSEGLRAEAYYSNSDIRKIAFRAKETADSSIQLFQNKPNPWNENTIISFFLPQRVHASVIINDVTGRMVYSKDGVFEQGINEILIDASALHTSGIYYYTLKTNTFQNMKKMILID